MKLKLHEYGFINNSSEFRDTLSVPPTIYIVRESKNAYGPGYEKIVASKRREIISANTIEANIGKTGYEFRYKTPRLFYENLIFNDSMKLLKKFLIHLNSQRVISETFDARIPPDQESDIIKIGNRMRDILKWTYHPSITRDWGYELQNAKSTEEILNIVDDIQKDFNYQWYELRNIVTQDEIIRGMVYMATEYR